MNSVQLPSGTGKHPVVITRVAETQWHAIEDDRVVGHGDTSRRPDGRIFLGIDSWQAAVFDQLAAAMLTELPTPLYTVVDEAARELTSSWQRAGFPTRRREVGVRRTNRPTRHRARVGAPAWRRDDRARRRGQRWPAARVGPRDSR